jgi:hypothetical protein
VQVRVTDAGGTSSVKTFTVELQNVNETPYNITLSKTSIAENSLEGTVIGNFSAIEPDTGDTNTFTLLDDAGGRFSIIDNKLVVANGRPLDFEATTSHTIQVQVTDAGGKFSTKTITIGVTNVDEGTASPALSAPVEDITRVVEGPAVGVPIADGVSGSEGSDFMSSQPSFDNLTTRLEKDQFSFELLGKAGHVLSSPFGGAESGGQSTVHELADALFDFVQFLSGEAPSVEGDVSSADLDLGNSWISSVSSLLDDAGLGTEIEVSVLSFNDLRIHSGDLLS